MAMKKAVNVSRCLMGKLSHGTDLLEELTSLCEGDGIRLGRVEALGSVTQACIGYYNQETREYEFIDLDEPLEIANLIGNVSLKEGKPIVHAHITLADQSGHAYGGHLAPGTIVFACEFFIQVFDGFQFTRGHDAQTGLPLWVD